MVFLHYVLAFAPAIGNVNPNITHPAWQNQFIHSVWFFLADGYLSVAIFFLISGTVLTYSFEDSGRVFGDQVLRRMARLGLPMAGSVLLAAGLYLIFPTAHIQAASLAGNNDWLRQIGPPNVRITGILKEIFIGGLIFGHAHFSLLLPGALGERLGLAPLSHSFNSPLWTLHLEFYGSLLVLMLVMIKRRVTPVWHRFICGFVLLGLIAHPLGLFVIGYLTAGLLKSKLWENLSAKTYSKILACAAILLGVSMSAHDAPAWLTRLYDKTSSFEKLPMHTDDFHFYSQYGAILIFFGVLTLPVIQRLLGSWLGRMLGKYSFSLYLVHFPILFTATSACLVWSQPAGHRAAILIASAAGLIITALAAFIFERAVDRPATEFSRRIRVFTARAQVAAVRPVIDETKGLSSAEPG